MDRVTRFIKAFGRFWYDFVVGDDPKIAAGVGTVLILGAGLVGPFGQRSAALVVVLAVLVLAAFTAAVAVDVARSRRGGS